MATYLNSRLAAIGDPTRFAILEALARSPHAVVDLAQMFPVSRPAVSQHLKVLKDAGLITAEKSGTRSVYQANPEGLAALREHFDGMWTRALAAFEHAAAPKEEIHHGKHRSRGRSQKRRR